MIVKLLTEHHLEFLSLKGGYRGSSRSTHIKMPHCWKSHALALYIVAFVCPNEIQWRSQNLEKVTHIKERLLDQTVILFNCVPFQNGNFS